MVLYRPVTMPIVREWEGIPDNVRFGESIDDSEDDRLRFEEIDDDPIVNDHDEPMDVEL